MTRAPGRVAFHTFGCKANQYDTERMRQELEARGWKTVAEGEPAELRVVNTCTVTNQADAQARRLLGRLAREEPDARIVVAGCSSALDPERYRGLDGVVGVVEGHDPVQVAGAALDGESGLVQLELGRLAREGSAGAGSHHASGVGSGAGVEPALLRRRAGATRGWLKVQDGCDRKCAFCATRLARGASRSRPPEEVVGEALLLAREHPELVLTGIHIGHYGKDLGPEHSLSRLLRLLLERVPEVRFRLGSIEATEVDELLLDLLAGSGGRVAPHLHMPLQSGADPVLRRMRRWHTREMYRARALEIVDRLPVLGLGADIITGFPGETDEDHRATVELVEELPYTYLHVFPFSPREGTVAADLVREMPVPQRVAGERSRELRERVQVKGEAYRRDRDGGRAQVVLEGEGRVALTGDYLRVPVWGGAPEEPRRVHEGTLRWSDERLGVELDGPAAARFRSGHSGAGVSGR